jgi:DNA-binding transcriptional regulator YiaG
MSLEKNKKREEGLSVPRHRDEEVCEQMKTIVKRIRTMLGLKQVEFAILLNATMQTVSLWETKGVAPQGKRQTPFGNFLQLLGLL